MYIERCILAFPLFILSSLHKPPTSKMLQIYRSLLASIVVLTLYHHAKSIAAEDDCCKSCNAYSCMERVAHCGNDGYLIAFGLKNCKHFNTKEVYEKFDENGQRFINCTGKCLIDFMDRYIQEHESAINCNLLKNVGFHSHANCYLACDFCKICKSNKLALLAAYDYRDFFSMEAIRQVFAVIKKCGLFNCFAMNL